MARAATAAMSDSAIGADDAVAKGPFTTSPARIWGAHMPAKFVPKTLGRRLTHSSPDSTASCVDLLVAVASDSRRLSGEVVVGVDRGQRDQPGHARGPRPRRPWRPAHRRVPSS